TGDIANGGDADDAGELAGSAEHLAEVELAQAEPQHRDADDRPGDADGDGYEELHQLVTEPLAGARQHGVEHHRAEDAADRVDQRSLPREHPLEALRRPDEAQQRAHYR